MTLVIRLQLLNMSKIPDDTLETDVDLNGIGLSHYSALKIWLDKSREELHFLNFSGQLASLVPLQKMQYNH